MQTIRTISIIVCVTAVVALAQKEEEASCGCGVFESPTAEMTEDSPVITKYINFPIGCKSDGKQMCAKMCVALVEASRDKGPALLCNVLDDRHQPFVPAIYSRSCGSAWTNTGMLTNSQVCCKNRQVIPCSQSLD